MARRSSTILSASILAVAVLAAPEAQAQSAATQTEDAAARALPELRLRSDPVTTGSAGVTRDATRLPVRSGVAGSVAAPVREPVNAIPGTPLPLGDPGPPPVETNPYDPLGIRLGAMRVYATIRQSLGWDTNPERVSTNSRGDALSRTDGEMRLESGWSRHAFSGVLRGSYDTYRRERDASRPALDASTSLRIDATSATRLALEGALSLDTERPGSPELPGQVSGRPLVVGYSAAASVTRDFNRLQLRLRGSAGRTVHEDARLTGGGVVSQRERDRTSLGASLRAAYEIHPGLLPFVELGFDRRLYDRRVGSSGLRRSSNGWTGRVGSSFELTRTLTGEMSLGYQTRQYDDPALRRLDGLVADAALAWSLTPITTLRLTGTSRLDETTAAGASGNRTQRIGLDLRHELRRYLVLNAGASFEAVRYGGSRATDRVLAASLGLDYSLNRALALSSEIRHERLRTTRTGSDYGVETYLLGLRFQR